MVVASCVVDAYAAACAVRNYFGCRRMRWVLAALRVRGRRLCRRRPPRGTSPRRGIYLPTRHFLMGEDGRRQIAAPVARVLSQVGATILDPLGCRAVWIATSDARRAQMRRLNSRYSPTVDRCRGSLQNVVDPRRAWLQVVSTSHLQLQFSLFVFEQEFTSLIGWLQFWRLGCSLGHSQPLSALVALWQ